MGQPSEISKIKHKIFTQVARWTMQGTLVANINDLPDNLIREFDIRYRCCEHKEKAVLKERIRVAMGLTPRDVHKHDTLADMATRALKHQHQDAAVVEMLEVACDRCPIDKIVVTDACRNCVAHHCSNSCPKNAIMIVQNRAYIDRSRCVNCGLCARSCRYHAIVQITRPCEQACAVDAIGPTDNGSAGIDYNRCVGCGACIASCPFGSVADYSQVIPVIKMMKQTDRPVHALLAPSFVGQFGSKASPMAVRAGLQLLGFADVVEVAKGAEIVAAAEAREFSEKMADGKELMTSSCCPAFVALIDKHYPNLQQSVSHTPSPMAVIASEIKKQNPRALTVFIGPCVAKKAEAADLRDVDAVLTFAELACLWEAAEIDLTTIDIGADLHDAGRWGRGFAKSGGVTQALLNALGNGGPEPKAVKADGLAEARQLLATASKKCLAANFIEGMACQGGCIAGPGTLVDKRVAERQLDRHCQAGESDPNERAAGTN